MLTYWETLIATRSNIAVSDSYAQLWGRKLSNAYTAATYTGTLPATLTGTKAGYLEIYKIYGNTEQTGTPTPGNPIMPSGCGELETIGAHAGQYKLPLTSAGQGVDIYLGEVQTTRRIKKLVLTGEEKFSKNTASSSNYLYYIPKNALLPNSIKKTSLICNELPVTNEAPVSQIGISSNNNFSVIYVNFGADVMNAQPSGNTDAGLKEYLAQQYANGTPVTVWYVLAEPETGIVNEPLMKIGDYADTVSMEQAGVSIPTAPGETTISWAGEGLAPSEVEFVYKVKR